MAGSGQRKSQRRRARERRRAQQPLTPEARRSRFARWSMLHWLVQVAIVGVGVAALAMDASLAWILVWNILGTVYAVAVVIVLALLSRRPASAPAETGGADDDPRRWFVGTHTFMTLVLTAVPAGIGVTAALMVILLGADADEGLAVKVVGVWAMLLAWAFLHWGFAQVYLLHDRRVRPEVAFEYPGTPRPSLVDYVYFAFTIGTTFAASDVTVMRTRTRWIVTIHSVLSFFLNALIIALSFNTIMSAGH